MTRDLDMAVDGMQQTMNALALFGNSEVKKMYRKVARVVTKEVLAESKRRVPVEFGTLEDSLTVRAAKLARRSGDVGSQVTTREGMFTGETFYGGFQEFGWFSGGKFHQGDSFLRSAIYDRRVHWYHRTREVSKTELPKAVEAARRAGAKKR